MMRIHRILTRDAPRYNVFPLGMTAACTDWPDPLMIVSTIAPVRARSGSLPIFGITEDALASIGIRSWFVSRTRWEKVALVVWSAILLVVSVRVFLTPDIKT